MHFTWMDLVLFAALLIGAHIVITRVRALIVKHRIAWLTQEITAAGSQIRHTAHVFCECCHTRRRRMIIYAYGGDELAPRIAHVCHRCNRLLHPMLQQKAQESDERPLERTAIR